MTKNFVVRFRVESEDLRALLTRLFFFIDESCETIVIEDFSIPSGDLPFKTDAFRDPKSGWPVGE